jgi:hypothetical protein
MEARMKRRDFLTTIAGGVAAVAYPTKGAELVPAPPAVEFPRPRAGPSSYWYVNVKVSLVPLSPGHCPKNRKLRINRARRWRRFQENCASSYLELVEKITRFPAYVIGPETGMWEPRPLEIQSYAFDEAAVTEAGILAAAPGFFVLCPVVKVGRYE